MNRTSALWVSALLVMVAAACSNDRDTGTTVLQTRLDRASPGQTITLEPGTYAGPIIVTKPVTLTGGPEVIITGEAGHATLEIADTEAVTIEHISIEGGDTGILVRNSSDVTIRDFSVDGSAWHGVLVDDSHADIERCQITGLRESLSQGIEYRNSDGRTDSTVSGCRVEGPVFEGIVTHVARVRLVNNEVTGATLRGIAITEMSDGAVVGNTVFDSVGAAYFCGDMSRCSIVDNVARNIGVADQERRSGEGHGVVVQYHSHAFVDQLHDDGLTGESIVTMLDSSLLEEDPAQ